MSEEKDAQPFYALIGQALTHWSLVEYNCSLLFQIALNTKYDTAFAVYWEVRNFSPRLELVNAALRGDLLKTDEALRNEWGALLGRIRQSNADRNKMAHGTAVDYMMDDPAGELVFAPYYWSNVAKPKFTKDDNGIRLDFGVLRLADLQRVYEDIVRLSADTHAFYDKLAKKRQG